MARRRPKLHHHAILHDMPNAWWVRRRFALSRKSNYHSNITQKVKSSPLIQTVLLRNVYLTTAVGTLPTLNLAVTTIGQVSPTKTEPEYPTCKFLGYPNGTNRLIHLGTCCAYDYSR